MAHKSGESSGVTVGAIAGIWWGGVFIREGRGTTRGWWASVAVVTPIGRDGGQGIGWGGEVANAGSMDRFPFGGQG